MGNIFFIFIFICLTICIIQTSRTNLDSMIKNINFMYTFLQSTKSSHFPLRGKVGQLSKRKRVLCWSIYFISLLVKVLYSVQCTRTSISLLCWNKGPSFRCIDHLIDPRPLPIPLLLPRPPPAYLNTAWHAKSWRG